MATQRTTRIVLSITVVLLVVATNTQSYGQNGSWNVDADGNWSVGGNWSSGTVADGTGNTATFPNIITVNRTVTLDSNRTIGNITFSDTSHDLTIAPAAAEVLTLDTTSGTPTISVADQVLTTTVGFSGNDGITKTGNGTLFLRGDSDFTGGFNIAAGTVRINNTSSPNAFGNAANTVSFTGNASLVNPNGVFTMAQGIDINTGVTGTFTVSFGEDINVDGVLSGDGTLRMSGGSASGDLRFRNTANTHTGTLDIRQGGGNAQLLQMASLADSSNPIQLGNGTQDIGLTFTGMNAPIVLNNRQIELRSTGTAGETRISASGSAGNTVSFNAGVTGTTAGTKPLFLRGSNTGANTVGAITDGAGVIEVIKDQGGTWVLSGVNTYTGDTDVNQGNLTLASTGSLLFEIGANGVNNQILGDVSPGTLTLDGSFAFDLTGADPTIGNTWDIVDSSILGNTTFNPSFSVNLFTDAGSDLWTLNTLGIQFQFDETTGVLSALEAPVPEPSTFALLALCLMPLGFVGWRRRRR